MRRSQNNTSNIRPAPIATHAARSVAPAAPPLEIRAGKPHEDLPRRPPLPAPAFRPQPSGPSNGQGFPTWSPVVPGRGRARALLKGKAPALKPQSAPPGSNRGRHSTPRLRRAGFVVQAPSVPPTLVPRRLAPRRHPVVSDPGPSPPKRLPIGAAGAPDFMPPESRPVETSTGTEHASYLFAIACTATPFRPIPHTSSSAAVAGSRPATQEPRANHPKSTLAAR